MWFFLCAKAAWVPVQKCKQDISLLRGNKSTLCGGGDNTAGETCLVVPKSLEMLPCLKNRMQLMPVWNAQPLCSWELATQSYLNMSKALDSRLEWGISPQINTFFSLYLDVAVLGLEVFPTKINRTTPCSSPIREHCNVNAERKEKNTLSTACETVHFCHKTKTLRLKMQS